MSGGSVHKLSALFVIRSLQVGGAERQLALLARGLRDRGHHITVCSLYTGGPLAAELEAAEVPVVSLAKGGRWEFLSAVSRLRDVVRRVDPSIVHGYMPTANLFALLAGQGRKVVWGVRASSLEFNHYPRMTLMMDWAASVAARWADLIIANSEAGAKTHIAQGYPHSRVRVIPNGIDIDRFTSVPDERKRQRLAWGIDEASPLIGLVGRLDPMKDHSSFLRAISLLGPEWAHTRFICVGDGVAGQKARLMAEAEQLGVGHRVMWLSAQAEPRMVYNALDVLTSCSAFGEGFSNAIGEAMACNVPCVVTDVGDSAVVVGDTGVVVPPRDPAALARAWEQLLSHRGPPPLAVRDRIVREFSVERLLDRTERALLGLDPGRP